MIYYTDGFTIWRNPSPKGGGYTVIDATNTLRSYQVIAKKGFTNNEGELLGILNALELAETGDTIISDSRICINWILRGQAGTRIDLWSRAREGQKLWRIKKINLKWENRRDILAGQYNERTKHIIP